MSHLAVYYSNLGHLIFTVMIHENFEVCIAIALTYFDRIRCVMHDNLYLCLQCPLGIRVEYGACVGPYKPWVPYRLHVYIYIHHSILS